MNLNKLTTSIRYGIPSSKLIDKILELRNPSVNLEYFSIYKKVEIFHNRINSLQFTQYTPSASIINNAPILPTNFSGITYHHMFQHCSTLNSPPPLNVLNYEYILPLFSYGDYIYYITQIDINQEHTEEYFLRKLFVHTYLEHPENFVKEIPKEQIFQSASLSIKEFEDMLLKQCQEDPSIIRFFIEKDN